MPEQLDGHCLIQLDYNYIQPWTNHFFGTWMPVKSDLPQLMAIVNQGMVIANQMGTFS